MRSHVPLAFAAGVVLGALGALTLVALHRPPSEAIPPRAPVSNTRALPRLEPTPQVVPMPWPPAGTLDPSGPQLTPIPAPPPVAVTEPPDLPSPPVPDDPATPAAARSVEQAIALANQGQIEAAFREYGRFQSETPRAAGLPRLRDAIRTRSVARVDELILSGHCADAQRLCRQLRSGGITPAVRDHFGSACPAP